MTLVQRFFRVFDRPLIEVKADFCNRLTLQRKPVQDPIDPRILRLATDDAVSILSDQAQRADYSDKLRFHCVSCHRSLWSDRIFLYFALIMPAFSNSIEAHRNRLFLRAAMRIHDSVGTGTPNQDSFVLAPISQMNPIFHVVTTRFCYKNQCYTHIRTNALYVTRRVKAESPLCELISTAV